jgi:hypothetical protein
LKRLDVDREEPFATFLFFHKSSQRAANALLEELRAKGRLTEKEMSQFAKRLETKELGFKFSKTNFYRKVLKTFLELGFVKKDAVYGGAGGKTMQVYMPIRQPIPTRAPSSPSFWYVTYEVCKWWNEIMFPDEESGEPE